MRELTPKYEGQATFSVIEGPFAETKERWAKVGMQEDTHGMVGLIDGKPAVHINGHKFSKEDLVAKIEELLSK